MKKALLGLFMLALVLPAVFADDALVMPAKVIRTYITGAYASITKAYDNDGKAQDIGNDVTVVNLGAAVEYGVTDWITGAVQWAPGYNVYSKIKNQDKASLADAADLFVGAKLQIVGPKAPVQNESIRFAVAPGVKIPLSSPDWAKQYSNLTSGSTFLAQAADRHTLGVGGRAYFDYVINEMFFLNLYSQFIFYPSTVKVKDSGVQANATVAGVQTIIPTYDPTLKYGYDLTLEFEPHFSTMLSDGLELSAGLPLTYEMIPATTLAGDTVSAVAFAADPDKNILTIGPNASLFFQKTFLPIEIKAGYMLPLMGKNNEATNTIVLQLKAYAKF